MAFLRSLVRAIRTAGSQAGRRRDWAACHSLFASTLVCFHEDRYCPRTVTRIGEPVVVELAAPHALPGIAGDPGDRQHRRRIDTGF
ncbi:MAG: hypothetical protein AB7P12_19880 [Alphaproteobacteria bacterium]